MDQARQYRNTRSYCWADRVSWWAAAAPSPPSGCPGWLAPCAALCSTPVSSVRSVLTWQTCSLCITGCSVVLQRGGRRAQHRTCWESGAPTGGERAAGSWEPPALQSLMTMLFTRLTKSNICPTSLSKHGRSTAASLSCRVASQDATTGCQPSSLLEM